MSYDTWKATNPADNDNDADDSDIYGCCDCCDKQRPLSRCWTSDGIETFACEECRS
jgi:hypothetical protein